MVSELHAAREHPRRELANQSPYAPPNERPPWHRILHLDQYYKQDWAKRNMRQIIRALDPRVVYPNIASCAGTDADPLLCVGAKLVSHAAAQAQEAMPILRWKSFAASARHYCTVLESHHLSCLPDSHTTAFVGPTKALWLWRETRRGVHQHRLATGTSVSHEREAAEERRLSLWDVARTEAGPTTRKCRASIDPAPVCRAVQKTVPLLIITGWRLRACMTARTYHRWRHLNARTLRVSISSTSVWSGDAARQMSRCELPRVSKCVMLALTFGT